jgi:predicted RNA-binding protein YlxR (DUF448 family)
MILDETGRAPGRGAYLCRDAGCWSTAGRRKTLEHALKAPVPDELAARLAAGPDALGATTANTTPGAANTASAPTPTETEGETDGTK